MSSEKKDTSYEPVAQSEDNSKDDVELKPTLGLIQVEKKF